MNVYTILTSADFRQQRAIKEGWRHDAKVKKYLARGETVAESGVVARDATDAFRLAGLMRRERIRNGPGGEAALRELDMMSK